MTRDDLIDIIVDALERSRYLSAGLNVRVEALQGPYSMAVGRK